MSLSLVVSKNCKDKRVNVLTADGKVLVGTLIGMDNGTNVILNNTQERIFSLEGVETHKLGLCVIRGENVAILGQLDEEADDQLDLSQCKAKPIKPVKH